MSLSIQLVEEGAPHLEPHVFFLPRLEASPAGRGAGVLAREIAPAGPGLEHPENAFEHAAVVGPRPPATLMFWEQRRDALPLLLGEKWFCHPQFFTKKTSSYQAKMAQNHL